MATLNTSIDQVKALLNLTQRAAMSHAEALFTEALFSDWLTQLAQEGATPGGASAADVLDAAMNLPPNQPPAISTSDQASQPLPAGAPSSNGTDQVQSTQKH